MSASVSAKSSSALPAGWSAALDPSTGRVYFQNAVTRTTQWDDPRPLPAGWVALRTADGRAYFSCAHTQSTSWDDPRPKLLIAAPTAEQRMAHAAAVREAQRQTATVAREQQRLERTASFASAHARAARDEAADEAKRDAARRRQEDANQKRQADALRHTNSFAAAHAHSLGGGTKAAAFVAASSWTCNACTYANPSASAYCGMCGTARGLGVPGAMASALGVTPRAAPAVAPKTGANGQRRCPTCEYDNPPYAKRCQMCDTVFASAAEVEAFSGGAAAQQRTARGGALTAQQLRAKSPVSAKPKPKSGALNALFTAKPKAVVKAPSRDADGDSDGDSPSGGGGGGVQPLRMFGVVARAQSRAAAEQQRAAARDAAMARANKFSCTKCTYAYDAAISSCPVCGTAKDAGRGSANAYATANADAASAAADAAFSEFKAQMAREQAEEAVRHAAEERAQRALLGAGDVGARDDAAGDAAGVDDALSEQDAARVDAEFDARSMAAEAAEAEADAAGVQPQARASPFGRAGAGALPPQQLGAPGGPVMLSMNFVPANVVLCLNTSKHSRLALDHNTGVTYLHLGSAPGASAAAVAVDDAAPDAAADADGDDDAARDAAADAAVVQSEWTTAF